MSSSCDKQTIKISCEKVQCILCDVLPSVTEEVFGWKRKCNLEMLDGFLFTIPYANINFSGSEARAAAD